MKLNVKLFKLVSKEEFMSKRELLRKEIRYRNWPFPHIYQ